SVLVREDLDGGPRLVAHLVAAADRRPGVEELRDFLRTRLPSYMIPAGFTFLERMPLTAHGKVHRSALAAVPEVIWATRGASVAPRNPIEQTLLAIWVDLLGHKGISVFDNFFDLGGHSLMASRVMARVANTLGVYLPIRAVFEAPTVAALSRRIEKKAHD